MNYTLHLASAGDSDRTIYSYVISNFEGVKDSGVFVAVGKRRHDESYCGHIALQRALRAATKMDGVISLHVNFDHTVFTTLGYELMDLQPALYPNLTRTTKRLLRRFEKYEYGTADYDASDASVYEAMALDDALNTLEQARTIQGKWRLLCDRFLNPTKIIR
ncbi:hypothetical protein SAFG77S_08048 [Streptomyces afghaniensis]